MRHDPKGRAAILRPAALLILLASGQPGLAETWSLSLRGVRAGMLELSGSMGDGRYSAAGELATTGLVGALRTLRHTATARGRVAGGAFHPARYDEESRRGAETSGTRILWENGVPQVAAGMRRARDVDPDTQAGAVDPLTALFAVLRPRPERPACDAALAVFDGRRAARVTLAPAGATAGARAGAPAGATATEVVCRGVYTRLGGYSEADLAEGRDFPFTLRYEIAAGLWRAAEVEARSIYGPARLTLR